MSRKLIENTDKILGRETGTVYKDPGGRTSIALVYPNVYSIGMSSLGYQGIYGLLNSISDVVCERFFLPDDEELAEFERTNTEIFSMESKRSLARFDIIAFSVSFENDYPNILKILRQGKVPSRRSERRDTFPLVIMGGVCAFFNPEPLADFIDIFFTGEAEEMLPEFFSVYKHSPSRDELYKSAMKVAGLYIPQFYSVQYESSIGPIVKRGALHNAPEVIKKRGVAKITASIFKQVITTPDAEFSDMYLLEAMRGCPWSCRFCMAGHIYNPVRKKELDVVTEEISEARKTTSRIGLIGPSLTDYPHASEVLSLDGVDFSITSLRASRRSAELVGFMKGHKSVSIAPEAGTERLRKVINKRITEGDIIETSSLILESGIEHLRLYFMIGLPTETEDDIFGIVELVAKIRNECRRGHLDLSVSTFVPKPFTPFQWQPMLSIDKVKERIKLIKKGLAQVRATKVFHDVPKFAYMQGVFSMGDRRVSGIIERCSYDVDKTVKEALRKGEWDYYIFREKGFDEMLPWDFIDAGVSKERLWEENLKAMSE